nr:hypothetical protein [Vibrio splendidus]
MKANLSIKNICKSIVRHAVNSTFSSRDTVIIMGLTGNARTMLIKEWTCHIDSTSGSLNQIKFALSRYKEARTFRSNVKLRQSFI